MPSEGRPPQLATFDMGAVGQVGVMEGAGHKGAFKDVLSAGDNLNRRVSTDIHLANLQLVRVGVLFNF